MLLSHREYTPAIYNRPRTVGNSFLGFAARHGGAKAVSGGDEPVAVNDIPTTRPRGVINRQTAAASS